LAKFASLFIQMIWLCESSTRLPIFEPGDNSLVSLVLFDLASQGRTVEFVRSTPFAIDTRPFWSPDEHVRIAEPMVAFELVAEAEVGTFAPGAC